MPAARSLMDPTALTDDVNTLYESSHGEGFECVWGGDHIHFARHALE